MSDRLNEINFVVDMIQKLCIEAQIALVAREKKGQLMVLVHDAITGEEYGIMKKEFLKKGIEE